MARSGRDETKRGISWSGYVCQGKCAILAANKSSAHSEVEDSSRLFASPARLWHLCTTSVASTVYCSCDSSVARASRSRDRAIAKEGWRDCVNPSCTFVAPFIWFHTLNIFLCRFSRSDISIRHLSQQFYLYQLTEFNICWPFSLILGRTIWSLAYTRRILKLKGRKKREDFEIS